MVSIVVFTLNEIDGALAMFPRLRQVWRDAGRTWEILVIDGGSTDLTAECARGYDYPVFIQEEKGIGGAFKEAMARAGGDVVVIFAPDGNSIPEAIPSLLQKMAEGNDMVFASRYLAPARSYDDDILTAFGNRMFTWLFNLLFRSHYTDVLGMYRAFRKDLAEELGVDGKCHYWGTQLLARATRKGLRIAEIPADEPKRIGGRRKMRPLVNGTGELLTIFREFIRS